MKIEFEEPGETKPLYYADIRTGQTFTWWVGEGLNINPDGIYLKGENGYTRLSTGDQICFTSSPYRRVIRLDVKLVVSPEMEGL